jgi:hypothetical protein
MGLRDRFGPEIPCREFQLLARPAMNVLYTIAGRRILIEAEDDWSAGTVSNLFKGWFLSPLATNGGVLPDATIRIRVSGLPPQIPNGLYKFSVPERGICHTDGQIFHLDFNGSLIVIGPGTSRNVDVWLTQRYEPGSRILAQIVSQAFAAVLRRCELYELPSAGVVPPSSDKAILIAGPSGSGKSTLTMQLAACGWSYLSDDTLLLANDQQRLEVYALRQFFALTTETIAALRLSQLTVPSRTVAIKERVTPQDLFPASQINRARPGAIFFPLLTHKTVTEVRRLTAAEAMTRLLRLCPWAGYDKPTAGKHLRVLGDLSKECVAFDFHAGTDVLDRRGLAADLCLSSMRT